MIIQFVGILLLGLIAGWLINYLGDVLPSTRRLSAPFCPLCGSPIPWNSYLLLKACPTCGKSSVLRKVSVLLLSVGSAIALWFYPSQKLGFGVGFFLLVYFGLVALIDLEHKLILHPVSIIGGVIGLGIGIWLHGIWMTLLGGIAGFLSMLALYYFGDLFARGLARLRGQNLDEVALGFGDVTLSGILGLILGWPGIFAGLLLAIVLGGVVSLFFLIGQLLTRGYKPFTAIPYAPFLIAGAVILLYRG